MAQYQSSYGLNIQPGKVGMAYDSTYDMDTISCANPNAALLFGTLAVQDSGDFNAKPPAASTDVTGLGALGFVRESQALMSVYLAPTATPPYPAPQYIQGSIVPVMRAGRMWVVCQDGGAVAGSAVNVSYDSSTLVQGGVYAAAVSSKTAVLPNAKFYNSQATAGGLVCIEFNLA